MIVLGVGGIKGGVGKTTLVKVLASGALMRGHRVHLYDGDKDKQLLHWDTLVHSKPWSDGTEKDAWPENLTMSALPETFDEMSETLDACQDGGIDVAIIDLRPGRDETTADIALVSDMFIIPARPKHAETLITKHTIEWAQSLIATIQEGERVPKIATALIEFESTLLKVAGGELPVARLTDGARETWEHISQTPFLNAILPKSNYIEFINNFGPLGWALDQHKKNPRLRVRAAGIEKIASQCGWMFDAVVEELSDE